MRVIKTEKTVEFEKRQGLPFLIESSCAVCKTVNVFDLSSTHYLGNRINLHGTTLFFAYCTNCVHEWVLNLKIRVSLEVEPT